MADLDVLLAVLSERGMYSATRSLQCELATFDKDHYRCRRDWLGDGRHEEQRVLPQRGRRVLWTLPAEEPRFQHLVATTETEGRGRNLIGLRPVVKKVVGVLKRWETKPRCSGSASGNPAMTFPRFADPRPVYCLVPLELAAIMKMIPAART